MSWNANVPLNSVKTTTAAEDASSQGKGHNIRRTAKRLLGYAGRFKKLLFLVAVLAIIGSGLAMTAPFLVSKAIDTMAAPGEVDFATLGRILLALAAVYLVSSAASWLCGVFAAKAGANLVRRLRQDAFAHLQKLPLSTLDRRSHGDLLSSFVNDADAVSDGMTQLFTQLFSAIVTILAALIFMLVLSPLVTLAVVAVTPLIFLVARFVTKLSRKQFAAQQKILGELGGYAEERIQGMHVIKAFANEAATKEAFSEINSRLYEVGQKAQWYSSITNPTTRLLNYLSYVLVGLTGGLAALHLGFSIGGIGGFITYSAQFSRPFNELSAITTQLLSALAAAERIFALLDEPAEDPDHALPTLPQTLKGEVAFQDVSFSYTPERPLIQNFSLVVPPGSSVAIVGPTGAGKTTLVNLLMRFYDVIGGTVAIDGIPISSVQRDSLRRSFGMVLQDTWLFEGTIRDNISYGKPDATDAQVITAAKAASAHSFIRRLPEGYDTVIDEGGSNLSQGQRQLLTIARTMLLDPPMLILDEATSSVDTLTEQKIQQTFLRMMQGRTSFVIAHRLSTIRGADLILVMKDGAVIEQGSHDLLLSQGGFYAKLYRSQFA